jgi:hypothetical protein
MGFFSPGFIIGAASSLSNQIETAQERNAAEMERRRNQFDILSRETKRELRKKRQSQEEQAAALETLIGQYPEGKAILSAIGDDTASRAGLYRDFAQRKQFDRNFSPKNFALSVFRSGMIEDGSFDPSKVVSVTKPVPMDDLEETGESFIETFGRKLTGAPSARELQETDVSRLSSDIPEATVKIEKVYNPLSFEDPAWNRAFKSFADTEGIQLGMTPTGQYSLENLQKAKGDVQNKLRIINTLRQYQAYTEDDIGGITGDVKDIYEVVKKSGTQFNTIVTQIAKDMNKTSVSEVLENLNKYAPKSTSNDKTGTPVPQSNNTENGPAPTSAEELTSQDLTKILKEQVSGDERPVSKTEEGYPVFKVVIDGVDYLIANVPGSPYIVQ